MTIFRPEGFHTIPSGQKLAHHAHPLSGPGQIIWQRHRKTMAAEAARGLSMEESLRIMQDPSWL